MAVKFGCGVDYVKAELSILVATAVHYRNEDIVTSGTQKTPDGIRLMET